MPTVGRWRPRAIRFTLRMHELARLNAEERRRIVDDFLDATFDGLEVDPQLVARMRSARPDLPEDPTPAQVDAWVELVGLVRDDDFRARVREMTVRGARQQRPEGDAEAWQAAAQVVSELGSSALGAGLDPADPNAAPIAAAIEEAFAEIREERGAALADRLAAGTDARAERYWQLVAILNGWPSIPSTVPAFEWAIAALRAHA